MPSESADVTDAGAQGQVASVERSVTSVTSRTEASKLKAPEKSKPGAGRDASKRAPLIGSRVRTPASNAAKHSPRAGASSTGKIAKRKPESTSSVVPNKKAASRRSNTSVADVTCDATDSSRKTTAGSGIRLARATSDVRATRVTKMATVSEKAATGTGANSSKAAGAMLLRKYYKYYKYTFL